LCDQALAHENVIWHNLQQEAQCATLKDERSELVKEKDEIARREARRLKRELEETDKNWRRKLDKLDEDNHALKCEAKEARQVAEVANSQAAELRLQLDDIMYVHV
jgi:hypothetical protein